MKKIRIIALILFSMMATSGYSQMQFGLNLGAQMPLGDMSSTFNTGFGFNLSGKYFVTDEAAFGINLGYNSFGTEFDDISCGMMPITALFEYHLGSEALRPYLGIDLGAYNYSIKYILLGHKETDSELYFGFAPTAGVLYEIGDNLFLNGNLKWNCVLTDNDDAEFLGINIGVMYNL